MEKLTVKKGKVVEVPDQVKVSVAMVELIVERQPWVLGEVEK